MPCQNSHTVSDLVSFCSSACSAVLADQAVDALPALDRGGHIDRAGGDRGSNVLGPTGIFAIRNRLMGNLVTHVKRVAPVIDAIISR